MVKEGHTQITVDVKDEIAKKFRELSGHKFDWKRGYIKRGIEEALILWIEKEEK